MSDPVGGTLLLIFLALVFAVVPVLRKQASASERIAAALESIDESLDQTLFDSDFDGLSDMTRLVVALEKLAGIPEKTDTRS